ncbi:hypothetical protein T265_06023 [Opisthorchis viverrini]|uniref:Uncharacterized protein n=1 Tax=Opisthorchis viverrini TaxID=6198 RepID=A0A075AEK6_OPIVI|nr:hypothetical protein T265_06023 [Opisthorchis viverrini]KER26814.1 hypothetical protein T265_06023 [Opisthorchis viverrini]
MLTVLSHCSAISSHLCFTNPNGQHRKIISQTHPSCALMMSPRMVTKSLQVTCRTRQADQQSRDQQPIVRSLFTVGCRGKALYWSFQSTFITLVSLDGRFKFIGRTSFFWTQICGSSSWIPVVPEIDSSLDRTRCDRFRGIQCMIEGRKASRPVNYSINSSKKMSVQDRHTITTECDQR